MKHWFSKFASHVSTMMGSPWAFLIAVVGTLIWLATGPMLQFNTEWNFIANTATTVITFLMVFLIQNTQNRDAKAMHLKLDELISAIKSARNEMIDIEELSDEKLEEIAEYYRKKREECEADEAASGTSRKLDKDDAKRVA